MRAQMEQLQQQLAESQQQPAPAQPQTQAVIEESSVLEDEEETHLEQRTDSELMIDGFPSSKPVTEMENEAAQVVQLFAEPSQMRPEQSREASAKETETAARSSTVAPQAKPVPVEPEKPEISIPVYRVPPKDEPFKERKPLSSFAIASMIMLVLLFTGFGYFYYSWTDEPQATSSNQAPLADDATAQKAALNKLAQQQKQARSDQRPLLQSAVPTGASESPETQNGTLPPPSTTSRTVSDASRGAERTDEEARLQVELTLRQMAEEEFQMRLRESTESTSQQPAETTFQPPAVEKTGALEQPNSAQLIVTSESMENQRQQPQALTDSIMNQPPIAETIGDLVKE